MAQIIPTFELLSLGSITFSGNETWVDILSNLPNQNSPIPSGKQIWIGYVTCIAQDKGATFELRPNLPGQSTGTSGTTQLRGFTSVEAGDSKDMDLYLYGNITTLAPVTSTSSGVEKLWLRIKSLSNASSTFEYMIYYTIY